MSAAVAVQKAVYDRLRADRELSALVGGRIYDRVPVDAPFPYLSFGPDYWSLEDADCIEAHVGTVQIDAWSRAVGAVEVKRITGAIIAALHDAELVLADPYALVLCRVVLVRHLDTPDGLTEHGVVQVEVMVERAAGGRA